MKKTNSLFAVVAILFVSSFCIQSGCHPDKSTYAIPPRTDEHPVASFLDTAKNLFIIADNDAQPQEFGYTFTSSKKGVLWAVGCKMPLPNNANESYTMNVWDDSTRQLLLTKQIHYTDTANFGMVDLTPTNETLQLKANYKYLVSISRVFGLSDEMPCYLMAYTAYGPFNFIPLTQGHITILYERIGVGDATSAPAFPANISSANFELNGFIDIGFYATEY